MRPSDVLEEEARLPVGFLYEIIEARHYGEAYHIVQRAHAASQKAPQTPLCQLVQEIDFRLAQRDIDEASNG